MIVTRFAAIAALLSACAGEDEPCSRFECSLVSQGVWGPENLPVNPDASYSGRCGNREFDIHSDCNVDVEYTAEGELASFTCPQPISELGSLECTRGADGSAYDCDIVVEYAQGDLLELTGQICSLEYR
jgi:hypothetical protein